MSDVVAAVRRELTSAYSIKLLSNKFIDRLITAVIDNLDREAMAKAIWPAFWDPEYPMLEVNRTWKQENMIETIGVALAAARPAAPAASDAARQAAHKGE